MEGIQPFRTHIRNHLGFQDLKIYTQVYRELVLLNSFWRRGQAAETEDFVRLMSIPFLFFLVFFSMSL